ncbi:MAG: hypothetical protein ACKOA8_19675 [Deltaproteobacteria bacterium]
MNFGKLILGSLIITRLLLAEGEPFRVSSSSLTPQQSSTGQATPGDSQSTEGVDTESNLISDLKYLAVSNWLQNFLGQRYTHFDKYVTPEFAEKYILDYKVARSNQPAGNLDLVGHLDTDSLKKWVRLMDSKSKGSNQIKPLWILSSNIPGLSLSPSETAAKIQDSSTAQLLHQLAQNSVQKLNAKLSPLETSLSMEAPPKNSSEIQSLTQYASRLGDTLVVWGNLSLCPGCTQPRFDILVYTTQSQTLSFVVGDDLQMSSKEIPQTESLKKSVLPIYQQFQNELENAFSEGWIQDTPYKLIIETIDSYRVLKLVETELSRGNGFSSPVFKKAMGKSAEYEIKSALSIEELGQRIQAATIPGFKSQVSRLDSSTLLVKYSR